MGKIVINKDRCKGCALCVEACPKKLIVLSDDLNKFNTNYAKYVDEEEKCVGCQMCAKSCPDIAICEVYR